MKKLPVVVALFTILLAGVASAQHRKPDEPSPPRQPPQQAQPREPQRGQPREPERGRPGGRVVVAPPPILPWWWDYPYPHGYPPYGFRVYSDWEMSGVRLDVQPEDAQVFVDKYYAGVVSDFEGWFRRLTLHAGPHLIEIRKTGYVPLAVEVNLYPGQTITYQRKMEASRGDESTVASAPAFEEGAVLPPTTPADPNAPPGDVKFDVTPKDAAIYADGFYVGIVDDFNGGQHMRLTEGRHHLTLVYDGYETIDVDLVVDSAQTITYRATMKKS